MIPNGAASSYCDARQALQFFDSRFLGDQLNDDNTRASVSDMTTIGNSANTTLQYHLDAGSGQLEGAALKGGRYAATDLQKLTGVSLRHLQRIVACLAIGNLVWRRNPLAAPPDVLLWAEAQCDALETGEQVFAFAETEDAGSGAQTTSATPVNVECDTITGRARRMFGQRAFEF